MVKPSLDDHYVGIVESRKAKQPDLIEWGDAYPYLEMLMSPFTPEGKPREALTLLVSIKNGTLRVKLSDAESHLCAWLSIENALRFFEEIEDALDKRTLSWEPIPEKYRRNGRH